MFFSDWYSILRVVVVGALAYGALLLFLRVSGKRTLSKLNAFDLIVTVALGSTLATVLLSKDVALAEGVAAFALLIAMQFTITWLSVRSEKVEKLVKAEPVLLYFRGQLLRENMKRERLTRAEILAAAREQGLVDLAEAAAIGLETDGTLTVIKSAASPGPQPESISTIEQFQKDSQEGSRSL